MYEIAFREDKASQVALSQVGGYIGFKGSQPVFKFTSQIQYDRFLELTNQRRSIHETSAAGHA